MWKLCVLQNYTLENTYQVMVPFSLVFSQEVFGMQNLVCFIDIRSNMSNFEEVPSIPCEKMAFCYCVSVCVCTHVHAHMHA